MAKKKPSPPKKSKASKPPSKKKSASKAPPSPKSKTSSKSKKSSKADTYKLVTLSAKTGKVTRPKKGAEVFYALQSPRGKIHKLETPYSQKYLKSDAAGILAAFKNGDPAAFAVHQQKTRTPVFHYEGKKKVYEYRLKDGKPLMEAKGGKLVPVKLYKYKLTGRRLRAAQRTVIYGLDGYVAPTGLGFTKKTKAESSSGKYLMVPVTLPGQADKRTSEFKIKGATIKELVKNIKPAIGLREMVKRGINYLGFDGHIVLTRPKNPYKRGTADFETRENWIWSVWGEHAQTIRISFGRVIDRLVNFSDALAVNIREAISGNGLRVTSLVNLAAAERRAEDKEQIGIDKIIFRPHYADRRHASDFIPLRPESKKKQTHAHASPYNAGIYLTLNVKALE